MLSIGLFVNGRLIDRINIVNRVKKNSSGETLYLIDKKYKIYHRREDGARELARKVLVRLLSIKKKGLKRGLKDIKEGKITKVKNLDRFLKEL